MKYCYDKNIAHRDIKTSNVLIDENGKIKVADFGLSQLVNHDENMNKFGGSLHYYSPEICKKIAFNPFKSDVWALGVLFYRLFTFSYPFDGITDHEIKSRIVNGFYPEKLSGIIGKIVRKMLCVVPEERISIDQLAKMEVFKTTAICPYPSPFGSKTIQLSKHPQLNNRLRRFSKGAVSTFFHDKKKDNSPCIAKCMNLYCSQTFLSSPIDS